MKSVQLLLKQPSYKCFEKILLVFEQFFCQLVAKILGEKISAKDESFLQISVNSLF